MEYVIAAIVLLAIYVTCHFYKLRAQAKEDTVSLIQTLLKNAQDNLGCAPDAASIAYLASRPFLAGKIWKMIGDGGGSSSGYLPEYADDCNHLMMRVKDQQFRKAYPCAHAVMQYAVNLCDTTLSRGPRCGHPKYYPYDD